MIYRPYTNSNAVPGNTLGPIQDTSFPSTSLLGAFISRLPYAYNLIDSIMQRNPKFSDFKDVEPKRQQLIQDQSVFLQEPEFNIAPGTPGSIIVNKDYQAFIYAQIDKDKTRRLTDYRRMAAYAELADCIDEICDECIVKDENDVIVQFNLRGDYTKEIKDTIEKEFKKFVTVFDLEDRGWEYFRNFLVDGELFFENIIDEKRRELGVVGVISLPAELINPVYQNVQNELVKGYLIRKPVSGPTTSTSPKDQEEVFFMNKAQVTYVHSNIWNEFKTIRLPFIENAKRAFRQLSLIEDSVVIYRLVRAPERLKFKVYTGNMPAPKAEAHLKRLMQQYWSKKNFDTQQGGGGGKMTNVYDPQSMLDSYWFARDAQGNGNDVEILPSGGCLAMDTSVPLLDGRTLTLSEMTQEFEQGKKNWVYSTNPETGEVVPGLVTWAGVTQKSASVMELELDNGEKIICTPDHKFPILGKGFVEAKDLILGESFIPHITDQDTIYQPSTREWQKINQMIGNFFQGTDLEDSLPLSEKLEEPKKLLHHETLSCLLVNIKYLDTPIEVGTLTIDGGEKYHNYHTFALSCGVFTKNSLGEIKDLDYFLKKLYNSLKVPTSRFMSADTPFKDGTEITRDELRFARYIIRIQRQFAVGIRDSFITHLKLKGFWKQYNLKQRSVQVRFNVPTSFMAMREQQLLDLKFDNFIKITGNNSISPSYAQKYYLGMTDDLMKENRSWLEKDAAFRWMVAKIEAEGPNWRELALAAAGGGQAGGEAPPPEMGGEPSQPALGGGSSGSEEIPSFGGSAPSPEGSPAETPTSEAPAPETSTPETPAPEAPPTV